VTLSERIARTEAQQRLPDNLHRFDEVRERRSVPRWIEWTRENEKRGADLTGYIADGCGPTGRAA
jgi:hypothetical protein